MKVYVAKSRCEEHGAGIIGVFATEGAAKAAIADSACGGEYDEFPVEGTYITHRERLRTLRIADGRDPETGY